VVGLIQGVSELFPISSLGHNVLIPALAGGCCAQNLKRGYLRVAVSDVHRRAASCDGAGDDHLFLAGLGADHRGFFGSLGHLLSPAPGVSRWQMRTADEKLAWMIVLATIPVGIAGLTGEHAFRVLFGHTVWAAVFLVINGLILLAVGLLPGTSSGADASSSAS